jgi:hypothetical protein
MATTKSRSGASNGVVPDARSRQMIARQVLQRLMGIQEARTQLEVLQITQGVEGDNTAEIEGMPPKTDDDDNILYENGKPVRVTYGEAYAENDAAQARVWAYAKKKGVDGLVKRMIAAEQAAEEAPS